MPRSPLVVLTAIALGCTGGSSRESSRTITGTCVNSYWFDSGMQALVPDCKDTNLRTYASDASLGWTEFDSTSMTPDGFRIGAPPGKYLLGVKYPDRTSWQFYETAADAFALGSAWAGRHNVVAASASTPATFAITGLEPWDSLDFIELTCSGGMTFHTIVSSGDTSISAGATVASATFDWYRSGSGLPDGAQGDVVYVHQGATRALPGTPFSYRTAARASKLPSFFVMRSGVPRSVAVTLGEVPQTGRVSLDWRLSTFEQYRADVNPAAASLRHTLLVDANPHTLTDLPHPVGGTPDLLWLDLAPGTGDQVLQDVPYGQFLPALWIEFGRTSFTAGFPVTAPGALSSATATGSIGRNDPLPLPGGPIVPLVTPPRDPCLDGADAFLSPSGVGSTPVLSWSPPSVGSPTSYLVELLQPVVGADGGTTFQAVAYLTTRGSTLRIPPGVLKSGVKYVASIIAFVKDPDTSEWAPYRLSYPEAWASTVFEFST